MAVTPSGTISLADINTATGDSATTQISLGGTAGRCLSNTAEGATVSMSDLRGKTCAGGYVTVGSSSSTSKGITTIRYGFVDASTGSATVGNLATYITTATGFAALNASSSSSSSYTSWAGQFNIICSASPGTMSARIKVGNNIMSTVSTVTYVSNTLVNPVATTTGATGIIAAANVGQTLKWVVVAL